MKKVIIIGASGTIGRPTTALFQEKGYEVVTVGRNSGDLRADLTKDGNIEALYEQTGKIDVMINLGGEAPFGTLEQITDEQMEGSLKGFQGNMDLVRKGLPFMNDGGVFVLTTGSTVLEPIPIAALTTAIGAGVNGFVRAAALSMPRDLRLNCVLPPLVAETAEQQGIPGDWISATEVANWYIEAVEMADKNGQWRDQTGWTDFQTGGLGWDADELDVTH